MDFDQIICGDCVKVMAGMSTETFDAIVTDPPYGVTTGFDDYVATQFLEQAFRVLKKDAALIMLVGQATIREFWNTAEKQGFKWLNTIVWWHRNSSIVWWHRNSLSLQTRRFAVQYDPILYFAKGDFRHRVDSVRTEYRSKDRLKYVINSKRKKGWTPNPLGARCPDVWEIPAVTTTAPNGQDAPVGHKWQKPLEVFDRMVKATVDPGGIILDPYCGSGTSLLAAKNYGVHYVGIDIEEKNVELSISRLFQPTKENKQKSDINDLF